MHNQLVLKYKGFIIPSRPDKKLIKNTDEKFVEERRLQMEKYLNIIAKHPILGTSLAFKIFTQSPNEKFEKEKIKAEATNEFTEYRSLEDSIDKVFALVQNKFQIIFSQKIVPFSKEMSDIEDKLIRLEAPIQTVSGAFSSWVQNHSENMKIFFGLKLGSDFFNIMSNYKSLFRNTLNSYKNTVEECCKLQTLISRKLGKHKSSSDQDTAARYLSEIQATQDTIDKYNKTLTQIEENVMKENSSFDLVKTQHLEQTIKEIITTQKEYYAKESSFWKESLKNLANNR